MKRDGESQSWLAVLKCKREDQEFPYGIYLHETRDPNTFLRTAPTKLQQLERRDLEGLVLKDIRLVVDYDVSLTNPRQFFTLRSADPIWDRCGYYICPNPEGHDGHGDGRRELSPNTRIELPNNMKCSCIYYQDHRGELTVILIGIKDYRPWIHLLTTPDLQRFIDTSPRRSRNGPDHPPALLTSPLTSEPSPNDAEPLSIVTSPISIGSSSHADHISPSVSSPTGLPSAGSSNHSNPQKRFTSTNPVLLRGIRTGCPVCAIIRHCGINIRDVKDSRADLLTETLPGKQIEVGVRKGQVRTGPEPYVEYVITISTDSFHVL